MHVKYEANWKYVLTIPSRYDVRLFSADALIPDVGLRGRTATPERRLIHGNGIGQKVPSHFA